MHRLWSSQPLQNSCANKEPTEKFFNLYTHGPTGWDCQTKHYMMKIAIIVQVIFVDMSFLDAHDEEDQLSIKNREQHGSVGSAS